MCGILLHISSEATEHPLQFSNDLKTQGCLSCFETSDPAAISALIVTPEYDREVVLSNADKKKLENTEELRSLTKQLARLRNSVKAADFAAISSVEAAIKLLSEIEPDETPSPHMISSLVARVSARGPDYVKYCSFKHQLCNVQLFSSVLSLRQPFSRQPVETNGFLIQFNGELYNDESLAANDTCYIVKLLLELVSRREEAILDLWGSLNGEFALSVLDLLENKVYFGKDFLGRRSLLYSLNSKGLTVCSLAPVGSLREAFSECVSSDIYVVELDSFLLKTVPYTDVWARFPSTERIKFQPLSASSDGDYKKTVFGLHDVLKNACFLRQSTIHPLDETAIAKNHSNIGILFSGGLDCTVIAALICENALKSGSVTSIDLLTVGFDNPRTDMKASESPDRKLSKRSWFELARKHNSEAFSVHLVEINVTYKDWLMHRKRVKDLIYPTNTEMDFSIAVAFYFASRGNGIKIELKECNISYDAFLENEGLFCCREEYNSISKVLFSGLGADELFGGYSRHESIFDGLQKACSQSEIREKYNLLSNSLVHDIKVIYHRNLGRDDRAISSWGKELRYPFLDNQVVNYVLNEVSPDLKVRFGWEMRVSKKLTREVKTYIRKFLLRELAAELGLDFVKDELKRAIQFGARSAKLEVGQGLAKGTDSLEQ